MSAHAPAAAAAHALLGKVRAAWRRTVLLRGALLALAVLAGSAAVLILGDQLLSFPAGLRAALRPLVFLAFAAILAHALHRAFPGPDDRRLALLAEERRPELEGYLVTALDAAGSGPAARVFFARAAERLAAARVDRVTAGRLAGPARGGAIAVVACLVVLALVPGGLRELGERWVRLAADPATGVVIGGARIGGEEPGASGMFRALRVRVEPPAYTRLPAREFTAAEPITAVAGSTLRITAEPPAAATELSARVLGGGELPVARWDARIRVDWPLSAGHRGLALEARAGDQTLARQVIAVTVVPDREPVVELFDPEDDLVLATASGVIPIRARARDDYGITDFRLTWILSRGSGESFSFTDGEAEWNAVRQEDGALVGEYALDVAAAGLQPGDVIHLRAVAQDGNTVTGPGVGASVTRLIRVARPDEMDQATTLIGFPIELEQQPILSQRMIILLTERLIAQRKSLDPAEFRHESEEIAAHQARLRGRVADLIYSRSTGADDEGGGGGGHDHAAERIGAAGRGAAVSDSLSEEERERRIQAVLEAASRATGMGTLEELGHDHDRDPSIFVNLPLIPALNAMYEAERELRMAAPEASLPHQYRALEILQQVREAERIYLRGKQTVAPVDVAAARGTGKLEDAEPTARSAAPPPPASTAASAVAELTALAPQLGRMPPRDAALALADLAARVLDDPAATPEAGALLGRAAEAAARGDAAEATSLVIQARAILSPRGLAGAAPPHAPPPDAAGADYLRRLAAGDEGGPTTSPGSSGADPAGAARNTPAPRSTSGRSSSIKLDRPFTFATVRYGSGDWDSAPLVPANLIHSIALYTDIPVEPEGVVVDLASPEIFRYPFLYMTGHLPVRFSAEEARNLKAFLERGGFIFIDDHNHDIDAAFHRTTVAELARIFGENALVELPNDHELYRAFFVFEDGPPTTSHELNGWGDGLIHENLYAILVNGRIGVLYSNKDYSSEWSYHVQNKRFQAIDNTRFGVNIIVYALTR